MPTGRARENLIAEGFHGGAIVVTGNTGVDALLLTADRPYQFTDPVLERAGTDLKLILVTAHRRESFGAPFLEICRALRKLAVSDPRIEIIYPVHPNPNIEEVARRELSGIPRLHLIAPLDYVPFVHLMKRATILLTDSGGIQEEAPSLNKPVLVMRDTTERPEAIEAGTAELTGVSEAGIVRAVRQLLDDEIVYARMAARENPFGDGKASQRIVEHLKRLA